MKRYLEDGTVVRVSKKTGQIIPKPHPLFDRKPRSLSKSYAHDTCNLHILKFSLFSLLLPVFGPKDTAAKEVFAVTFRDYEKYLPHIYASEHAKLSSGESQ